MLAARWCCSMQLHTDFIDPLVRLKFFGAASAKSIPLMDLLLGRQINGLGAGQVLALFIGGSLLAGRGIVRWQVPLGFFLGVAGLAALFQMLDPAQNASPLFHLCTGSVMLGGFFLATEIGNTPSRPLPMSMQYSRRHFLRAALAGGGILGAASLLSVFPAASALALTRGAAGEDTTPFTRTALFMPSFFGYMAWSVGILVPLFALLTWLFFM